MPAGSSIVHGPPVCAGMPSTLISASAGSVTNFTVPVVIIGSAGAAFGVALCASSVLCLDSTSIAVPAAPASTTPITTAILRLADFRITGGCDDAFVRKSGLLIGGIEAGRATAPAAPTPCHV